MAREGGSEGAVAQDRQVRACLRWVLFCTSQVARLYWLMRAGVSYVAARWRMRKRSSISFYSLHSLLAVSRLVGMSQLEKYGLWGTRPQTINIFPKGRKRT